MGGFAGFKDGKDKGVLPDSGEVRVVEGKVEEGSEEEETIRTEVFEMEVREVVCAESGGAFREFDGVGGVGGGWEVGGGRKATPIPPGIHPS